MGENTKLDELTTEEVHSPTPPSTVVTGVPEGGLPADDAVPAVLGDAKVDDGGVRTNSAVEPIADALGTGAGAPHPPPGNVGADGREQFPDGVAPTALATYDGPGAPPDQTGDPPPQSDPPEPQDGDGEPESSEAVHEDAEVQQLVDDHTADELAAIAADLDVKTSGTKVEVAERIVEARRGDK